MDKKSNILEIKTTQTGTRKLKGFLNIRDVWYNTNTLYDDADVVYYMNVDKPVGKDVSEFHTLLIDLDLPEEELWSGVRKKTKYEINFAQKRDELPYEVFHNPSDEELQAFLDDFDLFVKHKNIPGADIPRVNLYKSLGVLTLTRVLDNEGNTIVWHVYRTNQHRAMLIYSVSMWFRNEDRKLIGRANRFAHWKDILLFKEHKVKYYDMGGWYHKDDKPELLNINKFKESFGGFTVENYLCIDYPTFKGKLVAILKKVKRYFKY